MTESNNLIILTSSELTLRESSLITRGLELISKQRSILLFDDISLCNAYEQILSDDYTIYRTNKKEELTIILKSHTIDVLIADIVCFGDNGLEEIRKFKNSNPNIKIVNISKYNSFNLNFIVPLININFPDKVIDLFLSKPINYDLLQDKIRLLFLDHNSKNRAKTNSKKMLISDDEPEVIRFYSKIITDRNVHVEIFSSSDAIETKKMIESKPNEYDLFTTDNRKPFICGAELAGLLRNISPLTKILICSGYSDYDTCIEILENQLVDYYMPKPVDPDEYIQVICKLLDLDH